VLEATQAGNVGIGTTSPNSTLQINGAVTGKAATDKTGSSTIDFSVGNLQYTTSTCGAFTLNNMKDGGTYMFTVKNNTSNTCSFTAWTGVGAGALTMHLPPDHGATTINKHTVYTFVVMGADVYAAWVAGY
jgi:hypothetical protein